MATVADSLNVKASMSWNQSQTNEGGTFAATKQGPDSHSFTVSPSATTWTEVFVDKYSIAASGTQVMDFRSFTNFFNSTITGTGILGMMLKATATVTGGILKVETDGTNGLVWPITAGTTPSISLPVGTVGACLLVQQGTAFTVDATHRRLLLTNSGSQTITVTVSALISTA